ncbi:hypothetical protein [Actinocatenispora rupis]|uniref:Uncharacterized protein n=1 Tax=Actinocatenispora rupis TaxID=519421 RepID=A0A8J3IW90_9ACTN|nr:hypothetical protein [Actinocatenispora rupis]GID09765.1 hypothetical protein Aru02nite_06540 [Actinocatenispora rupis]
MTGSPVPTVRSRRWPWVLALGGPALAFVVALLVEFVVLPALHGGAAPATPAALARAGTAALRRAPALRYVGDVLAGDRVVHVDLRVTAAGDTVGTLRLPTGGSARLLAVAGGTYVDGDRGWWLSLAADRTGIMAGHWVSGAPSVLGGLDPRTALRPAALAAALGTVPAGARAATGRATRLGGTPVTPVTTSTGATLYLHGTVTALDARLAGRYAALDVTPVGRDTAARAVAAARRAAATVQRYDTLPARYVSVSGTGSCDGSSCTETVKIRNEGGRATTPGTVYGRLTQGSVEGAKLGDCHAQLPPIAPGRTATVRCTVHASPDGQGWYQWVTFSPGWQGSDPAPLVRLLDRGYDLEWLDEDDHPVEVLTALGGLIADPGWTRKTVERTCAALVRADLIGDVAHLVASGRLAYRAADLAADVAAHRLTPAALTEAVRRADAGTDRVAVGTWRTGGHSYRADVIDAGRHQTVRVAQVDSSSASVAVQRIAALAGAVPAAPPGYAATLRVTLTPAVVALYRLGGADLRDALRRAGLTRVRLGAVRGLTVVGAGGRATDLRATDF